MSLIHHDPDLDGDVDPEAEDRDNFHLEEMLNEWTDEPPIRHDVYPESDGEGADDSSDIHVRRGDGFLYQKQSFFSGVAFKEAVIDYALRTGHNPTSLWHSNHSSSTTRSCRSRRTWWQIAHLSTGNKKIGNRFRVLEFWVWGFRFWIWDSTMDRVLKTNPGFFGLVLTDNMVSSRVYVSNRSNHDSGTLSSWTFNWWGNRRLTFISWVNSKRSKIGLHLARCDSSHGEIDLFSEHYK